MKIFNIGIPEAVFLLVVTVIFLGPNQIVDFAGKLGRFIRKVTHSELWTTIWQTSRDIRNLPNTLAKETGFEENLQEIKKTASNIKDELSEIKNEPTRNDSPPSHITAEATNQQKNEHTLDVPTLKKKPRAD